MIKDMEFEEYARPKPREIARKAADFLGKYGAGDSDFLKDISDEKSKKRWINLRAKDIRKKNERVLKNIAEMIESVSRHADISKKGGWGDDVPGAKEEAHEILLELDKYMGKVPGVYDMPVAEAAALDFISISEGGMGFYENIARYMTGREYGRYRTLDNQITNYIHYAINPSIAVLQLRESEEYNDIRFMDMEEAQEIRENKENFPNCADYELVYVRNNDVYIETDPFVSDEENVLLFQDTLDGIYAEFNSDALRPRDYYGHSLSVGDIIVISDAYNNDLYAFYVNSKGFTMLPADFLSMGMKAKIYNRIDIKQERLLFEHIESFSRQNKLNLMSDKAGKRYSQIKDNYSDIFELADRRGMIEDMAKLGFEPTIGYRGYENCLNWDLKGYVSAEEEPALAFEDWKDVRKFLDEVRALTQNYALSELLQRRDNEDYSVILENDFSYEAVAVAIDNYPHTDKIFKLTGCKISREFEEVLEELAVCKHVTLEKINQCPEIVLANTIVSDSKSTMLLAGRDDLRKHILEKLDEKGAASIANDGSVSYNKKVMRNSRLDIIVGLPGSGKSSALANVISQEFNSRIIDSDEAKELLPEYNNGWGAGIVHNESKLISDTQLKESILKGENIVLPRVGGNYKVIDQIVSLAKKSGYKVYLHYVELSREKALGRMLDRFIDTGRFLAPELIDKYDNSIDGNKIAKTYEYFKKGGNINGYSKWSNDVGKGERPILIEQSECCGMFMLYAEQAANVQCLRGYGVNGAGKLDNDVALSGADAKAGHEDNRADIHKNSAGTRQKNGGADEGKQREECRGTEGDGAPGSRGGHGRNSEVDGASGRLLNIRRGR